jgi:hypothetical protein
LLQEHSVDWVACFLDPGVAQSAQEFVKGFVIFVGHLKAHQNATVIGTLVAIVKQTDVPTWAHQVEKFEQSAGALWKYKAHEALVLRQAGMATHHVPNMLFGQIVVRQVEIVKAVLLEIVRNFGTFA